VHYGFKTGGNNFNYFSETLISIFDQKIEMGELGPLPPALSMPL